MMSDNFGNQKRVAIWTVPRTLSSVLLRSLSQMPNSIALFEQFATAAFFGLQGTFDAAHNNHSSETFESVKALYEQPWEEKSLVLAKDMAYALTGRYEMIPQGYQHIILIRHPAKAISSLEAVLAPIPREQREYSIGFNRYKHLLDFHRHLTNKLDLEAIVLDAEDLKQYPEKTIQTLCQLLELPFSDRLLTWEPVHGIPDNWMMAPAMWKDCKSEGWWDACFRSTGFIQPTKAKGGETKHPLTSEIQKMVEEALPYYQTLRELCIKL